MLKRLLNTACPTALMLFEKDADGNEIDPKVALREKIAKGNLPVGEVVVDPPIEEEDEEDDVELDDDGNPIVKKEEEAELTPEQIKEKEANDKIAAKAQRKQDRMQRRIDESVAARNKAEEEVARLKAQLEANPELKLTAEEVETRANAIAAKKIQDKEIADITAKFQNDCDALQKDAKKIDKDFDSKIDDVAEQFGPIPSFMIGVLTDLDNGPEVLAHFANDEDFAEGIYKASPAKMTKMLVEVSNKLIEAKKKPRKEISKVEEPIEPVSGASRGKSTVITEADTKPGNMDNYVAKRNAQIAERRKQQGYR